MRPLSKGREGEAKAPALKATPLALALFALLALASCAVGPDYVKPPAIMQDKFKEMEGWKKAEPKDQMLRGNWWEAFNDPELNALVEQVEISNQNIAVAEANYGQSLALVDQAAAAYFPTATIGPSLTRVYRSTGSAASAAAAATASAKTVNIYSLPVNANWVPDLWGQVRRSVEAARGNAQVSAANLVNARLSAQAQLAQDYFQLRALDAQKRLLHETVEAYRKSLELTENRYKAGVASRGDVLQADTQLKTTQAQEVDVGVQRAQLEHAVALLAGKAPADFALPFSPLSAIPPAIPVGVPSELLERRPDVAAAERNMAAANAQIGVAIAAYYPTVSLGAAAGFLSTDLSKWLTWPSRFWSMGPAISQLVYDGGLRKARTAQARAAYEGAVASYRQTVLTGFQEVEDNLAALRILEQEAAVQAEAVAAAEQSLAVMENQYRAGTVAYLNVIVAQTTVLSAKITALGILGRRMTAAVLLVKALGGGWNISDLPKG
jgi:NodT family efflux transporter outer membrane factor (OMF) lipoprotein